MAKWRVRRRAATATTTTPDDGSTALTNPVEAADDQSTEEPAPEPEPAPTPAEVTDQTAERPTVVPEPDEPAEPGKDEASEPEPTTVAVPEAKNEPEAESKAESKTEAEPGPEAAAVVVDPEPPAGKTKRPRRQRKPKGDKTSKPGKDDESGTKGKDGTPTDPGGTGTPVTPTDGGGKEQPAGDVLVAEAPPKLTEVPDDALVVAGPRRRRVRDSAPVLLFRAAHPRQAALTALAMGGAAAVAGRPSREAAVVLATVLVGQTVLGWHNDLVDRRRDARHDAENKPVADGRLDPGTVWYAVAVAVLVLVPLSITTGITAGIYYLLSVAVAMLGHYVLRTGLLSWVPWAASFALLVPYLSYGGWGGQDVGDPPQPAIVVLAALLGIGVHVVRAVWGLVADHADEWTYLPLRLGLKLGATRLLTLGSLYIAIVVIAMAVVGAQDGLSR